MASHVTGHLIKNGDDINFIGHRYCDLNKQIEILVILVKFLHGKMISLRLPRVMQMASCNI